MRRPGQGSAGWLINLYLVEGLASIGNTLLMVGIFFFTKNRFGWGMKENFLLAAVQGVIYVLGALAAHPLTGRMGRRTTLIVAYMLMAGVTIPAAIWPTPVLTVCLLLTYTAIIAVSWPTIESLVSGCAAPNELSRRLGVYNLVWSGTAALALAANGAIIESWPAGMFLIPAGVHVMSVLLLVANPNAEESPAADAMARNSESIAPEEALLRQRQLALWLSRIALPSTYVVIYSLMAMFPSLPMIKALSPTWSTLLASIWLIVRWLSFGVLSIGTWWHTRPRFLLAAAAGMLVGFLGIVLPAAIVARPDVGAMLLLCAAQIILGACIGMIYCASLHFGMVLSEGSTEHGGYHEALIGLGSILGPGAAAVVQWTHPGNVYAGISTVAAVIGLSVMAAMAVSLRRQTSVHRRREEVASGLSPKP